MKTLEQVRADLRHQGLSMAAWARRNGENEELTRKILLGRIECRYGKSHKIAVKLGLKDGVIVE